MEDTNKCFECGKFGHWARDCYSKLKRESTFVADKKIKNKVTRCFVCRKLGHLARECRFAEGKYYDLDKPVESTKRSEEPPPPPSYSMDTNPYGDLDGALITQAFDSIEPREWDFIKNENHKDTPEESKKQSDKKKSYTKRENSKEESKYFKVVYLSSTKFNGFLDTCSERCLIKYSAAKKAHLNVQLDDTDVMLNSPTLKGKIVSIGKAVTLVSVDQVEVGNVELFVVSDDVLNIDVVIGRSWIDHPRVMMLKIDNSIHLADTSLHPFDKFRSIVSSIDVKPASSKKSIEDSRLELVSSSEDDLKSEKHVKVPKKRHHSKERMAPIPRKSFRDFSIERERGRDLGRLRSRTRSRSRERFRDDRLIMKRRSRTRSRSRSRDRYMSRRH